MLKSEMVTRLRDYIDDSDTISADNFSSTRLDREIFEGVQKATQLLKNLDDVFLRTEQTYNVTGQTVNLPTDFDVLIQYAKVDGNDIKPFRIKELREVPIGVNAFFDEGAEVELTPTTIRYIDVPANHTSRLTYIKRIVDVASNASYSIPPEVERLAILAAARNILKSENAKNTEGIDSLYDEARFDLNVLVPVSKQTPRYVRYTPL